jgi:hypothetical protein
MSGMTHYLAEERSSSLARSINELASWRLFPVIERTSQPLAIDQNCPDPAGFSFDPFAIDIGHVLHRDQLESSSSATQW